MVNAAETITAPESTPADAQASPRWGRTPRRFIAPGLIVLAAMFFLVEVIIAPGFFTTRLGLAVPAYAEEVSQWRRHEPAFDYQSEEPLQFDDDELARLASHIRTIVDQQLLLERTHPDYEGYRRHCEQLAPMLFDLVGKRQFPESSARTWAAFISTPAPSTAFSFDSNALNNSLFLAVIERKVTKRHLEQLLASAQRWKSTVKKIEAHEQQISKVVRVLPAGYPPQRTLGGWGSSSSLDGTIRFLESKLTDPDSPIAKKLAEDEAAARAKEAEEKAAAHAKEMKEIDKLFDEGNRPWGVSKEEWERAKREAKGESPPSP